MLLKNYNNNKFKELNPKKKERKKIKKLRADYGSIILPLEPCTVTILKQTKKYIRAMREVYKWINFLSLRETKK